MPFYPYSLSSNIYIYKLPIILLSLSNDMPEMRGKNKMKWKLIQAERKVED